MGARRLTQFLTHVTSTLPRIGVTQPQIRPMFALYLEEVPVAIPRLNPDTDPEDQTDPFGVPACTLVGLPAPMRLPAVRPCYADRYPPQIDTPVEVAFAMADGDSKVVDVCELAGFLVDGELSPEDANLARIHLGTCEPCQGRLHVAMQLHARMGDGG